MRIGILTQWYPPEPAYLPGGLATELAARGHEVRVLTAFPNYPGGKIYPGYRQQWGTEERINGVRVRRVPIYPSHDGSSVRRVANYLSYAVTSLLAAPRYFADVDVLHAYHPPATATASAVLLRLARRIPVLLHIQDLWPESVTTSGMTPGGVVGRLLGRGLSATMRRLYRSSDAIVVLSPSMGEAVVDRGADPETVRVVFNWTEESLFQPVPETMAARSAIGRRDRCVIMFAGNIGPFPRLETAVRAAVAAADHVDLVLVGSGIGEADVRHLATKLGATNVRFLGRRPPEEMAALYAAADFQLVTLRDHPAMLGTIPSKLQAAMACGRPIVISATGDAARLVDAQCIGLTAPAEDWRALAGRFVDAALMPESRRAEMGARARRVYLERMSRRTGVDQIEDVLHKIARERGGSRCV